MPVVSSLRPGRSFPRRRESIERTLSMDSRFRGNDGAGAAGGGALWVMRVSGGVINMVISGMGVCYVTKPVQCQYTSAHNFSYCDGKMTNTRTRTSLLGAAASAAAEAVADALAAAEARSAAKAAAASVAASGRA
ncbi:hypothetical protein GEV02_13985, partial [Rugamonas sp. FT29W]|nr:hypothetical protein [Rugamonas aquatica]